MKKVLIVVDDISSSESILSTFHNIVRTPVEIVLLYVERLMGKSRIIDMLGDAELSTLKKSLEGTEYKEKLDKKAEEILLYYIDKLKKIGYINIKPVIKEGIPSEEILKVVDEESAELVIIGQEYENMADRLIAGSIRRDSSDIEKRANVYVLIAKQPSRYRISTYNWKDVSYGFSLLMVISLVVLILESVLLNESYVWEEAFFLVSFFIFLVLGIFFFSFLLHQKQ